MGVICYVIAVLCVFGNCHQRHAIYAAEIMIFVDFMQCCYYALRMPHQTGSFVLWH